MRTFNLKELIDIHPNLATSADIAFLLLIFFFVNTTINTEQGMLVELPSLEETLYPVSDRNVL